MECEPREGSINPWVQAMMWIQMDAGSGKLEAIEQTATEKIPRAFNIDPTGKFLVVAGQDSGKIAVFMIDNQSGKLTQTDSVEVGKGPAWVEIVARP